MMLLVANCSTVFASLFFATQMNKPWKRKPFKSSHSYLMQLWTSWRGRGRQEESAKEDADHGTPAAVDAPVDTSMPLTVFKFHPYQQHRQSSVKVHIGQVSEKCAPVELSPFAGPVPSPEEIEVAEQEAEEEDIFDASARTMLLRPMEMADQGATGTPNRRRPSFKEHLTAMHVSGKDFVDRLRTSGRLSDSGRSRRSYSDMGQNDDENHQPLVTTRSLLLPPLTASTRSYTRASREVEHESEVDDFDGPMEMTVQAFGMPSHKSSSFGEIVHHSAPVHNILLPPLVHVATSSSVIHSDASTSAAGAEHGTGTGGI